MYNIEAVFNELKEKWNNETFLCSNSETIYGNIHYKQIILLGDDVIPLILKDWETSDNHWFNALEKITNQNPINPKNRGIIKLMKKDWIDFLNNQPNLIYKKK